MRNEERRAAVATYKERKVVAGIYAVRCSVTGKCWVGSAPDLSTVENRLWFTLRLGGARPASLQAAYQTEGRSAFVYEELERMPEEKDPYIRGKILKQRLIHWSTALPAEML